MRHAIVVFTKVPKAGETKTRLTTDRGGIFTPEEAKIFYEACLLDVIDSCLTAGCGDVYICYNQAGDSGYLQQLLEKVAVPHSIKGIFADAGGSFDHAMQSAADYILKNDTAERLADSILIVGGDMPCLQPATIQHAFRKIEILSASKSALECARPCDDSGSNIGAAIVESADQAGGFNLIGYTFTTPFTFESVFYNQQGVTVLDRVVQKTIEYSIPIGLVEMVPDIDILEDLGSMIPIIKTLQLAEKHDCSVVSPKRTVHFLEEFGIEAAATIPKI